YLPPPLTLQVGTNAACLEEPLLFYLPVVRRPDSLPMSDRSRLEHRAGFREVTAVRIFSPHAATPSPALQAVEQMAAVAFHQGPEYLAEIGFDGEGQGRRADLRPALPLLVCW